MDRAMLSRRQFLRGAATLGAGTLLTACVAPTSQVMKETVVVEKEVVQTQVVEKVVTGTPPPAEPVNMTYFVAWGGDYGTYNEEVAKMYTANHPNVKIETLAGNNQDKLQVAIAGGTPPDIAHQFWLWTRLFITQDALVDLTDFVASAQGSTRDAFAESYWDMCDSRGKSYAVPYFQAGVRFAMFWNKRLFEEAGLDPEQPPKDIDELIAMGKKMTKVGSDGNLEVLGWNSRHGEPFFYWARALGAEYYDATRRQLHYNNPAFLDFITKTQAYTKELGFDKISAWSDGINNQFNQSPFVVEKAAIVTTAGDWFVSDIRAGNPELEGHYGVTYVPSPIGQKTILGYTHTLTIPKGNPNTVGTAWDFIDYACGSEEVAEYAYKVSGSVAPYIPWREKQDWTGEEMLPFTDWFLNTLNDADYSGPEEYPDLAGMLGMEMETRANSAYEATLAGQLTPAEMLDRMDQEIQPLLDQAIKQYNL